MSFLFLLRRDLGPTLINDLSVLVLEARVGICFDCKDFLRDRGVLTFKSSTPFTSDKLCYTSEFPSENCNR